MFRFTIRDVLWLTVVVGLMVGWLVEHRRALRVEQNQKRLAEQCQSCESKLTAYQAAIVNMGQFVREKTGESVRIRVLEDVLDQ
jgi:uncharacterized membrane-anchored protein YhcB (DUF1043 family)